MVGSGVSIRTTNALAVRSCCPGSVCMCGMKYIVHENISDLLSLCVCDTITLMV